MKKVQTIVCKDLQADAHVDIWVTLDNGYRWNNTNRYKPPQIV